MKIGILFIHCIFSCQLIAQVSNWTIQAAYLPGKLSKHTEKMLYDPRGIANFAELDFVYQTQGSFAWERYYKLPRYGVSMRYLDLGKPHEILGNGFSIAPYMDFGILQHQSYSFHFMIACGLAYLNLPYDIKTNSLQTAIGSHWNNHTSFQIRFEHTLMKKHAVFFGMSLSHTSNGAFKSPNLGLNYLSGVLGIGLETQKQKTYERLQNIQVSESEKGATHFSFQLEWGATWKETRIPNGPKYLINFWTSDIGYQYTNYKSWRLAVDIENNHLASYFSDYTELRKNKKQAAKDGLRLNVYGGHQWLFGGISLSLKAGYQFLRNISLDDYPVVTKLALCYLVPYAFLNRVKPYVGISLKTHFGTAEYIGVMAGLRLDRFTNK